MRHWSTDSDKCNAGDQVTFPETEMVTEEFVDISPISTELSALFAVAMGMFCESWTSELPFATCANSVVPYGDFAAFAGIAGSAGELTLNSIPYSVKSARAGSPICRDGTMVSAQKVLGRREHPDHQAVHHAFATTGQEIFAPQDYLSLYGWRLQRQQARISWRDD